MSLPAADGDLADDLAALSATFNAWLRAFEGQPATAGEAAAASLFSALADEGRDDAVASSQLTRLL